MNLDHPHGNPVLYPLLQLAVVMVIVVVVVDHVRVGSTQHGSLVARAIRLSFSHNTYESYNGSLADS